MIGQKLSNKNKNKNAIIPKPPKKMGTEQDLIICSSSMSFRWIHPHYKALLSLKKFRFSIISNFAAYA